MAYNFTFYRLQTVLSYHSKWKYGTCTQTQSVLCQFCHWPYWCTKPDALSKNYFSKNFFKWLHKASQLMKQSRNWHVLNCPTHIQVLVLNDKCLIHFSISELLSQIMQERTILLPVHYSTIEGTGNTSLHSKAYFTPRGIGLADV